MTGKIIHLTIDDMGKPGRRQGTPTEFRIAFARRIWEARERAGLTPATMAEQLSRVSGREITRDTYRKWEIPPNKPEKELTARDLSMLPYDLILAFCDLTRTHPYDLLRAVPFEENSNGDTLQRKLGT